MTPARLIAAVRAALPCRESHDPLITAATCDACAASVAAAVLTAASEGAREVPRRLLAVAAADAVLEAAMSRMLDALCEQAEGPHDKTGT